MAEEELWFPSVDPDTFSEGGGLALNGVDAALILRYENNTYAGTRSEPAPALKVAFKWTTDGEDKEEEHYYSVGSSAQWGVHPSGLTLVPTAVNSGKVLSKSSRAGTFFAELKKAGCPAALMAGDLRKMDGIVAHIIQIPVKDMEGKEVKNKKGYVSTIPVPDRVVRLPGEKAASVASSNPELADKVAAAVKKVIAEAGGTLEKSGLAAKLMSALKGEDGKTKSAAVGLAVKDEWLKSKAAEGLWVYEDGVLIDEIPF